MNILLAQVKIKERASENEGMFILAKDFAGTNSVEFNFLGKQVSLPNDNPLSIFSVLKTSGSYIDETALLEDVAYIKQVMRVGAKATSQNIAENLG